MNSSHTEIYTLSLHDALPILMKALKRNMKQKILLLNLCKEKKKELVNLMKQIFLIRSEEHTYELQSHRDLHSFPTRRSSDSYESFEKEYETKNPPSKPLQGEIEGISELNETDLFNQIGKASCRERV